MFCVIETYVYYSLNYIFATIIRVVLVITSLRKQRDDARELVAQLQIQMKKLQQINKSFVIQMNELIDFFIELKINENEKKTTIN